MQTDCRVGMVLFDFGGVIAEEGFKEGLRSIAKQNGLDEEKFIAAGDEAVHTSGYVLGKGTEKDFWRILKEETGIVGNDDELRNEILSRFVVRTWVLALADLLRSRGIGTGILSDQTDWLDGLERRYDFFRFFDIVFNSYHLGDSKRNPEFFDTIAKRLAVPGDQILFIDDNPGNCKRARAKGWHAIAYTNREDFIEQARNYCPFITAGEEVSAG